MKNNNQSRQQLGLVDSPAFSTDDTENFLHQDELRALENTFPSGKPINDDRNNNNPTFSGVYRPQVQQQQLSYEQWEQKVLREQRENFNNKTSLFQSSPTNAGISTVDDGVRPSQERIEQLRKEESINQLSQRLALLQNSEARLRKELERNLLVQREIKKNLDETTAH